MNMEVKEHILEDADTKTELKTLKNSLEEKEILWDKELFIKAVAEALAPITDLQQIPETGLPLKYKGTPEWDLPKTINFFPKKMNVKTLPYAIIEIGTQTFKVTPWAWAKIDGFSIDVEGFHFSAGWLSKTKDKEEDMWKYLRRLNTEGEFGSYTGTTVTRIPFLERKNEIKKLHDLNDPKNPNNANNQILKKK